MGYGLLVLCLCTNPLLSDLLGSAFTILGSYGLDCLIPYNAPIPRSILREISVFLIPLLVLIVISAFWLLKWYRTRKERMPALRSCLLTAVVLFNASYISLTHAALNAFYCVPVHDWRSSHSEVMRKYWAIDTSVLCGSRSHRLLLGVVGIPGLMFSVVFPIFLVVFIVQLRNNDKLNSEWARETLGIFLGGYKESFVYWDAVILLRKAMLSAVLAFAYNLGGKLQGLLGIVILVLSLFLQMALRPFKEQLTKLNMLESVSLLITAFTLIAGVILDDETLTSDVVRWMLIGAVFVSNVGIVAYLAILLAGLKVELKKHELLAEEVDCGDGGCIDVIKASMQYALEKFWEKELGLWENDVFSVDTDQYNVPVSVQSI